MKYENIQFNINNNIAILSFDVKKDKVNTLFQNLLEELNHLINSIKNNSEIKVLLIKSNKDNNFIAGANINEIRKMYDKNEIANKLKYVNNIFNTLQNLPYKTICIINGSCMGGGLELALCCDYRIGTNEIKTKLALPEVKLGIFPGFGGTYRLPKLIGLINSLDLILTGKTINSKKAFKIGLIDKYCFEGDLEDIIDIFIKDILEKKNLPKRKNFNIIEKFVLTRNIIFKQARKKLKSKLHKEFKAPYEVLNLIQKSYNDNINDAIKKESIAFSKIAITKQSKNLIDLFLISQDIQKDFSNNKIKNIVKSTSIIGNGIMGKGIIWLFSKYLNDVRVKIRDIKQTKKILFSIEKLYSFFIKTKKMSKNDVEFKLNKISYTDKFDGFNTIDLVVEAIVEDEEQKTNIYTKLENVLKKDSIISTNTSSISINVLNKDLKYKDRFIGIHFFNPVNKMPLVEVIPSKYTSKKTIEKSFELLRRCNKIPILVEDCAGFLVNRILLPYINESAYILEDGSDIKSIDKVIKEFGIPMGPFMLADTVGIDVGFKVCTILYEAYGSRMQVSNILKIVHDDLKLLGVKSKKGFYIHKNKKTNNIKLNLDVQNRLQNSYKYINKDEIVNRTIFIMINEASRCLEEGIIKKVSHLDFAMIAGIGFPAFRGGLLKYADEIGIDFIIDTLEKYQNRIGDRFTPSNLLYKLRENNKTFYTGEDLWNL